MERWRPAWRRRRMRDLVMEPPGSGCIPGERHCLSPDRPGQPPTWIPSRARAQIPRQVFAKPGRGGGEGAPFPSPSASDAFGWAHLISLTVFMFSSLTLAVWSTSLRKYLLLKVVAITTTSLHARPSISEMQNLPLKACAAHQRGIGAHYFYIILQANRYFPIHISFLS